MPSKLKSVCIQCGKNFIHSHSSEGKYCSNTCNGIHKSKLHKENWINGTLTKHIDRDTIRRYLSEDRGYKCEVCGISDWQDKKITLHVDHTNGDPSNSSPENVRLICPNCHSQTPFLGQANKGRGRKSLGLPRY